MSYNSLRPRRRGRDVRTTKTRARRPLRKWNLFYGSRSGPTGSPGAYGASAGSMLMLAAATGIRFGRRVQNRRLALPGGNETRKHSGLVVTGRTSGGVRINFHAVPICSFSVGFLLDPFSFSGGGGSALFCVRHGFASEAGGWARRCATLLAAPSARARLLRRSSSA